MPMKLEPPQVDKSSVKEISEKDLEQQKGEDIPPLLLMPQLAQNYPQTSTEQSVTGWLNESLRTQSLESQMRILIHPYAP